MGNIFKVINQSESVKMLYQCSWLIERTVEFKDLTIRERAVILAPEGKSVTLIVNGVVREKKAGRYMGHVVLYVSDSYVTEPSGLMGFNRIACTLAPAVCVENGKLVPGKSVSGAVLGGTVTDAAADGVYISAAAEEFNGIVIDNSEYTVKNAKIDLEGFGADDFAGIGSAVAMYGKSKVEINDSKFTLSGVTRCAVHVGGDSVVRLNNCDIVNISPQSDWTYDFSWQIALRGSNRLCQLSDNGQVEYNNCRLKTNGWGVVSIDGSDEFVRLVLRGSRLELTGPNAHGYGAFCIGPNELIVDNSEIDVYGYPLLIMGMAGKGRVNVSNGSVLKGRRFGAMVVADDNSVFTAKDSTFDTGCANIVVKGSASVIDIDNCEMKSKAGVLLQLMDTDESGMDIAKYHVPVGVSDTYIEGRDLTSASERDDIILNLSNLTAAGDIYNSTTNIRAYRNSERGGMGAFHDTIIGPVGFSGPSGEGAPEMEIPGHNPEELRGPKNLGVNLKNAHVEGVISAAAQSYREGVTEITVDSWYELTNITQTAAAPVNNGVVLTIDTGSSWIVTGASYLSSLTIAEGAKLEAASGKKLAMTVNGKDTPVKPGSYQGKIVISLS